MDLANLCSVFGGEAVWCEGGDYRRSGGVRGQHHHPDEPPNSI